MTRVDRAALAASLADFRRRSHAKHAEARAPVASVLDEDPATHTARVQAEHRQVEATMAWAAAQAKVRDRATDDASAPADNARKRAAAAMRKMADARDARLQAQNPQPAAHDRAA